ncbi:hypothetical protein BDY19DRAFT_979607, partial [Irpex rosettiformis]
MRTSRRQCDRVNLNIVITPKPIDSRYLWKFIVIPMLAREHVCATLSVHWQWI